MLLGLDLGTSSVKALLMAEDGDTIGEGSASYPVRSPHPGWAESFPEDWWNAVVEATQAAVGPHGSEVGAIGLSGQMHGVVLADDRGHPLRPAILWADTRSAEQLATYRGLDEDARERLANPPAVGMAGPTLLWLRDHEPETYASARWALQPKDWLRLRLTGEAAAEPSDASATLLYDLLSDDWDYTVVEALDLRAGLLAPLVASAEVAGTLTREAAKFLGLRAELPVAAGAADTAAAMLGGGLLRSGLVQLTVGTGGQIVAPKSAPEPDPHRRTHLYRAATPDLWYSMAAIQNAGLALEWARNTLGASWHGVYEEAFAVSPGAGGVVFLPYLSGERTPRFDPDARGAWVGLGLEHGRGHLLRAALEGVAFALREGLEALEEAGTAVPELRLAGGGTAEKPWQQLLADVLGRPLRVLPGGVAAVASARGASLLAGASSGEYRSWEDVLALAPDPDLSVLPGASEAYDIAYARYQELYPSLYG
ncbi:MAG TPA: xylulokinase [Rubrobacteraceae bacterium]|nr:xylulokinase [Rubrobacteraceae bacterium]